MPREDLFTNAGGSNFIDTRNFTYDYYSGANVGIFIGSNHVSDAVGLEGTLVQNKQPIYGYGSSLWDGVAAGVVQAHGVLWLNYTQNQLMSTYIANAESPIDLGQLEDDRLSADYDNGDYGFKKGLKLPDQQFLEENSEALKAKFWGSRYSRGHVSDAFEGANISESSLMPYARPDQHSKSFDIVVTYGVPFERSNYTNSTMKVFKGVHITGSKQSITVGGEPIIETYPFIAREVI